MSVRIQRSNETLNYIQERKVHRIFAVKGIYMKSMNNEIQCKDFTESGYHKSSKNDSLKQNNLG